METTDPDLKRGLGDLPPDPQDELERSLEHDFSILQQEFQITEESEETQPGQVQLTTDEKQQLREVFEEIFIAYLDPIKFSVSSIQKGVFTSEVQEIFGDALVPLMRATKRMNYDEIHDVLDKMHKYIAKLDADAGRIKPRQIKWVMSAYADLTNEVSEPVRKQFLADLTYERGTSDLLDMIRGIKYVGPVRIQRLYAMGLYTIDAFEKATAEDIRVTTAIPMKLCEKIHQAVLDFKKQRYELRINAISETINKLNERITEIRLKDDIELIRRFLPDFTALLSLLQERYAEFTSFLSVSKKPAFNINIGSDTEIKLHFHDILHWLAMGRKTGVAVLVRDSIEKRLYVREGAISGVQSNDPRDSIGRSLQRYGKLTDAQISNTLKAQKETGHLFGVTCLEKDYITEDELLEALRKNAEEITFSLFTWEEGKITFLEDEPVGDRMIPVHLSVYEIVLHGVQIKDEWAKIREAIPFTQIVFRAVEPLPCDISDFSETAQNVLSSVDGQKDVDAILPESQYTEFETMKALAQLKEAGAIRLTEIREKRRPKAEELVRNALDKAQAARFDDNYLRAIHYFERALALEPENESAKSGLTKARREFIYDLEETIPSLDDIPYLMPSSMDSGTLKMAELDEVGGFILSRIDNRTNIKYLASMSGLSKDQARKTLYRLVKAGFVEIKRVPTKEKVRPEPQTEETKVEIPHYEEVDRLYKEIFQMNHFMALGISYTAGQDEVRSAFLALSRKFHPDSFSGNISDEQLVKTEEIFRRIRFAYETLHGPEKRRAYEIKAGFRKPAPEPEKYGIAAPKDSELERKCREEVVRLLRHERYRQALQRIVEGLKQDPRSGVMRAILAMVLIHLPGRSKEALRNIRMALQQEPDRIEFRFIFGKTLRRAGHLDKARAEFDWILSKDPNHREARKELETI